MIDEYFEAVKTGQIQDVENMLKDNPDLLQSVRANGETPLMVALYHGKTNIVQQLLSYGVAISFHEAAAIGDVDTMEFLLDEHHVPINDFSFDGWTPLHLSAFFGHFETAKYLINHGADVNAKSTNSSANMPIHAAVAGRKFPLVQLLLEHQADPNVKQEGGWTPLHQAVQQFDKSMVELLLDHGADPNIQRDNGQTPLTIAEERDYEEIAVLLKNKL